MPEIAFETSREERAMNSEDDIMSDEEDELRLRQVTARRWNEMREIRIQNNTNKIR